MFLSKKNSFEYFQSIFWKFVLCISIFYEIFLISLLFKTKTDARNLQYICSSLGKKLPERSYAENCSLNFEIVKKQLDGFVISHTIGSYIKALLYRDYWICWIMTIAFEILEYSLEHQLPNFAECWWDHWILDVILCNGIGIYFGIKTIEYFQLEKYYWKDIKPKKNNVYSFNNLFDLLPKSSFRHYIGLLMIICFTLQCELNVFYLKYLLWIPAEHYIVTLKLLIYSLVCAPCISEIYYYYIHPKYNKLGLHTFFTVSNIWTETIICFKLSKGEFTKPPPLQVKIFWIIFILLIIIYPIITFYIIKRFRINRKKEE